ncbi:hypothetical protein RRG08_000960 [Elysia crispata]|uniref:Uncharacterized protein n=1 Tax=Elysia crispata TaxID=231223 RepID=A0AAE1AF60_9GAST|nr:hypothetical protein RRG08_000960 [Elysia crispata]
MGCLFPPAPSSLPPPSTLSLGKTNNPSLNVRGQAFPFRPIYQQVTVTVETQSGAFPSPPSVTLTKTYIQVSSLVFSFDDTDRKTSATRK